jgi:hypothetical protein
MAKCSSRKPRISAATGFGPMKRAANSALATISSIARAMTKHVTLARNRLEKCCDFESIVARLAIHPSLALGVLPYLLAQVLCYHEPEFRKEIDAANVQRCRVSSTRAEE